MLLEAKTSNSSLTKQQLKIYKEEVTDKVIASINLPHNNTMVFGDSMFAGQIYSSNNELISRDNAMANGLPMYNMTECEHKLRKAYNLAEDSIIIYVTSATDALLNEGDSTSYGISAYDSVSKQRLDLDNCKDISISVEVPLTDTTELNMTQYTEMKEQGIDIFDPNDPIYNDICISYTNTDNSTDTTLNWRRHNLYPQKMPMCIGVNCTYQGISEFNYVKCDCTGMDSGSDVVNQISKVLLDSLSEINIGIVTCYKQIPSVRLLLTYSLRYQPTLAYI
jgi:hypothetical protein